MAVDWSEFPKDLLQLVFEKLNSEFYRCSFRSVCSSWRSSVPKINYDRLNLLTSTIQIHSKNGASIFPLFKRSLFLISPPFTKKALDCSWLVKIGPDSRHRNCLFWNPLSVSPDNRLPLLFRGIVDFNRYCFLHLGNEFFIGDFPCKYSQNALSRNSIYKKKLVSYHTFHYSNGKRYPSSALLTIHVSGRLAIFQYSIEKWTIIPEVRLTYVDVCVFNGQPIAVDSTGRTVTIQPQDLSLVVVAEAVFHIGKILLVESDGELLLVNKCVTFVDVDVYWIGMESVVSFDVFRLDNKEKKWVKVTNLKDRVLFWGDDSAFSVSASDLGLRDGNCVIFSDDLCVHSTTGVSVSVFCLDKRQILPNFPCNVRLYRDGLGCSELCRK